MTVSLAPLVRQQFIVGGAPVSGGLLFTYQAGTTTKLATYTDSTGNTPNTNPIVLDANGACDLWVTLGTNYKLVLSPSTDTDPPTNPYWTRDNITAGIDYSQSSGAAQVGFLQVGSGAVARTVQSRLRDSVSIFDFLPQSELPNILARTSTYDCTAAINNAIASVASALNSTYVQGPKIYFPPGRYTVNSTIDLKASVHFVGTGSGLPFGITSELYWPIAGTNGIVINAYNTANGGTQVTPTTSAAGTIIEGLRLTSTGSGAVAHGIWVRAAAVIRDCYLTSWQGNGIQVVANSGGGGAAEGNASETCIERTSCYYSGQNGILMSGADANICKIDRCDCSNNTLSGFYDHSFLGNTYLACHAANNLAAPYKTDNTNAQNVFIGCYVEGGQPACSFVSPTIILGGVLSNNGLTNGTWLSGNGSCSGISVKSGDGNVSMSLGNLSSNAFLQLLRGTEQPWIWRQALGKVFWDWANNGNSFFEFYDPQQANPGNGYARDVNAIGQPSPPVGMPSGYLDFGMRARITLTAAPTTGTWIVGDIVYNANAASGGFIGWVCTTAGTPGTWKTFGLIS